MNRTLVSAGIRSAGVTIRHVCSVDMLKTARVLANVGSDCGGMGYGQYGDPRRMGICEVWAAVYGLRDVGLRTLRFFVNLWKVAGVYGGRPVVCGYGKCGYQDVVRTSQSHLHC